MRTKNRDKEFLFSQKKLHLVFALSSLLLLVSCVAMVWQDFDRSWKGYQRDFKKTQLELARLRLDEAMQNIQGDQQSGAIAEVQVHGLS